MIATLRSKERGGELQRTGSMEHHHVAVLGTESNSLQMNLSTPDLT